MAIAAQTKNKPQKTVTGSTVYPILLIIGICHMLNDTLQAVIPAMFPILERSMGLTFTQLGLIAFTLNMVSSVMQPAIGWYTDKRPMPYALPIALFSSAVGIFGLAFAPSFATILLCVVFIGLGSAIFHPEGSRVANMAAGPRRGLAQSIYQVGGNTGSSLCSANRSSNSRSSRSARCGLVYDCWNDCCRFPSLYFEMVRKKASNHSSTSEKSACKSSKI